MSSTLVIPPSLSPLFFSLVIGGHFRFRGPPVKLASPWRGVEDAVVQLILAALAEQLVHRLARADDAEAEQDAVGLDVAGAEDEFVGVDELAEELGDSAAAGEPGLAVLDDPDQADRPGIVETVDERALTGEEIAADQPAVGGEGDADELEVVRIAGEGQPPVLVAQRC